MQIFTYRFIAGILLFLQSFETPVQASYVIHTARIRRCVILMCWNSTFRRFALDPLMLTNIRHMDMKRDQIYVLCSIHTLIILNFNDSLRFI